MEEIWKDVPGCEGSYQVSDQGRVRSLDRRLKDGRFRKGRILKQDTAGPYAMVRLSNKTTSRLVHVLVLEAFVGPRPMGLQGAHGPLGRRVNSVANLRWATVEENAADRKRDGTAVAGEAHPRAKLTEAAVQRIRAARASGVKLKDLALEFGVHLSTVALAASGRTWRA